MTKIAGYLTALSLLVLAGCGTPRYQLEIGARGGQYTEQADLGLDQQLAQLTGGQVTLVSGDPNKLTFPTVGFYAGFTERLGNWLTRITGFYDGYTPVTYGFKTGTTPFNDVISVQSYGVDASTGYRLGVFRPHVGWRYEKAVISQSIEGWFLAGSYPRIPDVEESRFWWGIGLGLEIPLGGTLSLVGDGSYYIPNRSEAGVKISHYTFQFGFRFMDFGPGGK